MATTKGSHWPHEGHATNLPHTTSFATKQGKPPPCCQLWAITPAGHGCLLLCVHKWVVNPRGGAKKLATHQQVHGRGVAEVVDLQQ